jgi:hypothetical protein
MLRRRYEILLPLRHNDGRPVSDEKLNQTREELVNQFDGISVQPQSILGIWVHEGVRYEDTSVRLTVDVDDTPENRQFFLQFKAVLLERFEQVEIYIASYPLRFSN